MSAFRRAPTGFRRRAIAALVVVSAPWMTGTARADAADTEARAQARALADEAANAYAAGEFQQAHDLLRRAFAYVPAPTISLLDARALMRMNRWVDARDAYLRASRWDLGHDAPAAFRQAVQDAARELSVLEPRIPTLQIRLPAVAAEGTQRVLIDERTIAPDRLGQPILLDPTSHRVRLQLNGRETTSDEVVLREGEHRTYTFESPGPEPTRSAADSRRTWGWISMGVGGLGLATGGITGAIAMRAHSNAEDECPARRCEPGSDGADAVERFRTYRAVSTVGYVVGIAGAGVGAVLILTSSPRSATRVGIAPSWNGVQLVGTL